LLVARLAFREPSLWSVQAVSEAGFLAAVTALAYGLWDWAMREGDLLLVAACSYLTPLFSTVLSCFYLHVAFSSRLWIGCGLLVIGSFLTWLSITERDKEAGALVSNCGS